MSKTVLIDTNIILRVLVDGLPSQRKYAKELFEKVEEGKIRGLVSLLVVNELIWILEKFYHLKRGDFVPVLIDLLSIRGLNVYELQKSFLKEILEQFTKSKLDWTDIYLHHLSQQKQINLETFDKELKNLSMKAV